MDGHCDVRGCRGSDVLVFVPMIQVWIVWMLVQDPRVPVPMAMGRVRRRVGRVLMLVMNVMHMAMLVLERLMQMLMIMRLGEV